MPTYPLMQANKQGFTLIEIMVVLFIVGITASFALLAFGDFGESRRVNAAAQHFLSHVQLTQQQAIMEGNTLGILLREKSYQTLRFRAPSHWDPIGQSHVFKLQHFPSSAHIHLESPANAKRGPQIVVSPAGEVNAFTLSIRSKNQTTRVVSDPYGRLLLRVD